MGDFAADTAVVGQGGRYRAFVWPEWKVWGPHGGYVAAIALRAMGQETALRRPASISCQFLAMAEFDAVDLEVTTLRKGKRSHALHVRMVQRGGPVLAAKWEENPQASAPVWHTWMRLLQTPPLDDPFLDAARSLMWMDLMMWNAATPPHMPWPPSHIAPNVDVTCIFHASAAHDEWLLCDSHAPVGRDGIIGCSGRVWSPDGRLIASGNSCLFCKPNPFI